MRLPLPRKVAAGDSVDVRPVRSKRDLIRFIRLPWRLYRGSPLWVPPLISERKRFLDRDRNPFFEHADAEYFMAWRGGEPVGRISAHIDHRLNEYQDVNWGLFGFFECEDDRDVANELLATAERWLSERGCDRMVGPMDFNTNHECGLLVEGFERPPQILENWHHPYYAALIEGYGLTKAMDLWKWELGAWGISDVREQIFKIAERVEEEHGLRFRNMRRRDFEQEVRRFTEVYVEAWRKNWMFVPPTENEIRDMARELKPVLDEEWAMIMEERDSGEVVAAALTLPDYNQVLRELDGRLLPFGWAKALRARRRITSFRVIALGVKEKYRRTGVAARMYKEHWDLITRPGARMIGGEMGWILETNTAMNGGMEAMGGKVVKKYRVYETPLAG
jgi:GNAT superfamily N-acetyltransferase